MQTRARGRISRRLTVLPLLALMLLPAAGAARSGEEEGSGLGSLLGEGIDFKGGMLDWEEDEEGRRVAVLRNYAVIILPEVTISARNMVLNVETQEVYAEGDVVFTEKSGNAFYCDQIVFNYQEWQALAQNVRIRMDNQEANAPTLDFLGTQPRLASERGEGSFTSLADSGVIRRMYVQAGEMRAHDRDTFELIDAKITPSAFSKPHWYFSSPAALLRRGEKIESYHNKVVVGKMPVLYFPYVIRDLKYDWPWMRVTAGRTSDYGYFLRTRWGWNMNSDPASYLNFEKMYLDADWFSRRGVGTGMETTYRIGPFKEDSIGRLKLYGVYEYAISRDLDEDRAENQNDTAISPLATSHPFFTPDLYRNKFRWAVDWEHYQKLNELWDIRAEAHLYHDRDYLREYDPNRYWLGKEPENSVDIRRLDKNWSMDIVAQAPLSNRWLTQSEYLPEVRATVPALKLGNLPIYFKDDFRMGIVNRRFDSDAYRYSLNNAYPGTLFAIDPVTNLSTSRLWDDSDYGASFRAFNEMRLEAPIQLWDAATLKLWAGMRTAYYQDTLGTPLADELLPTFDPKLRDEFASVHYRVAPGTAVPPGFLGPDAFNPRARRSVNVFTPGQMTSKGPGSFNYAFPFGADLSTRTYTVFGANDQWRLMSEPTVSYLENARPHIDYERGLYPIDAYDVYTRQRRFGFELHNKLQRRYYERASGTRIPYRDILDFNLRFYYYPREIDQGAINYDRSLTEMEIDLTYRPTTRLTFSTNLLYDAKEGALNRGIFSVDWRLGDMFRVYAAHYHYKGHYWRSWYREPSEQTHFAIRTKLWNDSSRYSLEAAVAFEWRSDTDHYSPYHPYPRDTRNQQTRYGFNEYRITLFRDLDTFELSLTYAVNRNRDDHGFYFNFAPKNFMGGESPMPIYTTDVQALADGRYSDPRSYAASDSFIDPGVVDADLKDVQF